MNDFLQKIRNGSYAKDNRQRYNQQRQHKNYDGVNGNYKPNNNDKKYRSQKEALASEETLKGVQTLLDRISNNQVEALEIARKRADVEKQRANVEKRKLAVLEQIANHLGTLGTFAANLETAPKVISSTTSSSQETTQDPDTELPSRAYEVIKNKGTELKKDDIMAMILSMRNDGATYHEIADHLSEMNLPTFSGRGKWHAQTIHRLCQSL